jgi:hypothetical protein
MVILLKEGRLVRGRTSRAGEEKYKRKDYIRKFFRGTRRRWTTKLRATIWRNSDAAELLWWCTNASMGSGAAMPPPNFVVPNVAFVEPYCDAPGF